MSYDDVMCSGPRDPVERIVTLEVLIVVDIGALGGEDDARAEAVRDVERALKAANIDADVECTGMEDA